MAPQVAPNGAADVGAAARRSAPFKVGCPEHVELWAAINEFAQSRNGIHRQHCVVRVEQALYRLIAAADAAEGRR